MISWSSLLHSPFLHPSSSDLFLPLLFRSAGYQLVRPPVAVGDGALTGECDWTARSLTSAYRKRWTLAGGGDEDTHCHNKHKHVHADNPTDMHKYPHTPKLYTPHGNTDKHTHLKALSPLPPPFILLPSSEGVFSKTAIGSIEDQSLFSSSLCPQLIGNLSGDELVCWFHRRGWME